MNFTLSLMDFFSLSPLIILLFGGILILFMEIFFSGISKKSFLSMTLSIFFLTLIAIHYSPISNNPLITSWIAFTPISKFFSYFFVGSSLLVALLSNSFLDATQKSGEYFFLLLSATFGLFLIGLSADFLTLFIGLETLSITLYIWCSYMKKWGSSQESSIKYFLLGSIGTAILLYGIALLYGATGTTQFNQLLNSYAETKSKFLFSGGITLITVGLAFKAAIFPFHSWAPDVYEGAPTPVTAFMAVGTKAGAFAAFMLIFLIYLPNALAFWNKSIIALSILTLLYSNFLALRQVELKRFFAYSGISHAGFLLIPLATNGGEAIEAMQFYLLVYSLATLGAFSIIASMGLNPDGNQISHLNSYFYRSPILASIMTLCLLTLAGFPPTAGFLAKLYLFKLAYQSHLYILLTVALFTSLLSAYYYLRIILIMFTKQADINYSILKTKSIFTVGLFSALTLIFCIIYPSIFQSFR